MKLAELRLGGLAVCIGSKRTQKKIVLTLKAWVRRSFNDCHNVTHKHTNKGKGRILFYILCEFYFYRVSVSLYYWGHLVMTSDLPNSRCAPPIALRARHRSQVTLSMGQGPRHSLLQTATSSPACQCAAPMCIGLEPAGLGWRYRSAFFGG